MDQNTSQTSFIPKQPAVVAEKASSTRSFGLVNFLAIIIFLGSIVSAGAFYFYKNTLTASIASMNSSLQRSAAAFEPSLISDLQTLDRRLNDSNAILASHITVSPIFDSLEALTLKSVSFNKFDYELTNDKTQSIDVKLSGQTSPAGGYKSIALESNQLAQNKYFKNIIFSNLALAKDSGVSFDLEFSVDPNFLLYSKNINNQ